jgi:U6 snRNA-associated Sm-like protein LSm4
MLVELKSGETYNGRLVNCDSWMNINLKDVICTSADGTRFWKLPECYIRGSSIKYLRVPEDVVDRVPEDDVRKHAGRGRGGSGGSGRFGSSGRGRGGGRGRGRYVLLDIYVV